MTRLTEEMVALRTKISNMNLVKKLNCWGTGLSDIAVVQKMRNIEVLALSVNNISSLEAVRDLPCLETLYLRKNQISELGEIVHLKTLPSLKYVWLDENPFCERLGSKYRQEVLRILPKIERLDDIEITDNERQMAMDDVASQAEDNMYEDAYETEQQNHLQQQKQNSQQYQQYERSNSPPSQVQSPTLKQNSPPLQNQPSTPQQQHNQFAPQQYHRQPPYTPSYSPPRAHQIQRNSPHEPTHPPSPKYDSTPQQNRLSYQQPNDRSPEHESPQTGYQSCYRESGPIPPSISTQSMKEYYESDRPAYSNHYARSQTDLSDWTEHHMLPRRSAGNEREILERHGFRTNGSVTRENSLYDSASRVHCSYHRRLLNRNSNILSATLCLIKEMDVNSLEVVEHAVRSRLNEYAQIDA